MFTTINVFLVPVGDTYQLFSKYYFWWCSNMMIMICTTSIIDFSPRSIYIIAISWNLNISLRITNFVSCSGQKRTDIRFGDLWLDLFHQTMSNTYLAFIFIFLD